MFNKDDILVIRKVHIGVILMRATLAEPNGRDLVTEHKISISCSMSNDDEVAAFSNITECTEFIRELYSTLDRAPEPPTEPMATTSEPPEPIQKNPAAVALGQKGGRKGGKARAEKLTPEERSEIAKKGAAKRWGNKNTKAAKERSKELPQEPRGFMCNDCGETFEQCPMKCKKCGCGSFEQLGRR